MNTTTYLHIHGLPEIRFAHRFAADQYTNTLIPSSPGMGLLEISYLVEGTLTFTFDDENTTVARAGDILCFPYLSPLGIRANEHHEHHTVCFTLPFSVVTKDTPGALCLPLLYRASGPSGRGAQMIDEIIRSYTVRDRGAFFHAGLFLQLLDHIDRHTRATDSAPPSAHVRKAKAYIFDHLHEPIRQADVAAYLGITPEYLCSLFREAEGMPMMAFINRVKLEQIRTLMENNHLTLARAAEQYGYSDPNYVSRLYSKYFGTPITRRRKG